MMIILKQSTFFFLLILCIANSFCPEIEKQALLNFKKSLNNPSNLLISSWNPNRNPNCCEWEGVVCSSLTGHVLQLRLRSRVEDSDQFLRGKANLSTLLHLKNLKYLDLSQNKFEGTLPPLMGSFKNLEYLNLSHAGFHGRIPHNIGNLSNLQTLILEGSGVTVEGLEWLSGLVQLKHLNMDFIDLKKVKNWLEIINSLPSLLELHLSSCRLEFLSPLSHVNTTSLTFLDLSRNEFDSLSIGKWIFRQSNLIFLDLSRNYIKGTLPLFSNLTKLQHFDVSWNKLTSTIPNWIYFCKELKFLFLGYNSLNGTISKSVENLKSLETLSLRSNLLYGEIPREITNSCRLKMLDLSNNKLEGEISNSFGNMSSCFLGELRVLRLRENKLSGNLTHKFGEFKRLRFLDLTKNSISGSIPSNLGELQRLDALWLGFNKLSGELPVSLGQLSNLKSLSIGRNMLEGIVNESHFSNLTKLKNLFASGNNLTLRVGENWTPPFQLEEIGLGSWNLGEIPKIPSWIELQRGSVSVLDLSDVGLNGVVPSWFWGISVLNLSHNQFHGGISDFVPRENHVEFPYYRWIYLSSNRFTGILPRVSYDTMELDLSNNLFFGNLSHFLCGVTNESYGLKILHLDNNLLSGEIPDCWAKWSFLEYLNLGNNNLHGRIPSSLGFLDNLLSLNLYGNKLLGEIPFSMHNCTKLVKIDLRGNGLFGKLPKWMGTSLSNLMILILSSNKFSGDIPSTICHLNTLQILDLSSNYFYGEIPKCVQNFTAMATRRGFEGDGIEYSFVFYAFIESVLVDTKGQILQYHTFLVLVTNINLSNNNFSGEIPEEITSLVELKSLNLSGNLLKGSIPQRIGDMRQLESLDLSRNLLSSEIPNSISSLSFLSYLNLSYNFLKGKIPESAQLSSMDASSFVGNDLCGPPLPYSCKNDNEGDGSEENDEEGDESEVDWFYVFVLLGYVVGFLGVCITLLLSKSWREAYFGWLELVWNKVCVYSIIKWLRLIEYFNSKIVKAAV